MAEIQIFFPTSGKPKVFGESTAVLKDEYIFWNIHNENKDVKKVRIEFRDEGATFFEADSGKTHAVTRELAVRKFIWGKSPHPPGQQMRDKYSVCGLDEADKEVVSTDPTIISDDP